MNQNSQNKTPNTEELVLCRVCDSVKVRSLFTASKFSVAGDVGTCKVCWSAYIKANRERRLAGPTKEVKPSKPDTADLFTKLVTVVAKQAVYQKHLQQLMGAKQAPPDPCRALRQFIADLPPLQAADLKAYTDAVQKVTAKELPGHMAQALPALATAFQQPERPSPSPSAFQPPSPSPSPSPEPLPTQTLPVVDVSNAFDPAERERQRKLSKPDDLSTDLNF